MAEASYIGGYEGATEYWWMRISPEGKRTQVTEPRRVPYPHLASCDTHLQSTTVLPVSSSSVVPPLAVAPSSATPETVTSIAKIASEVGVEEAGASTSSEAIVVDPRYYLLTAGESCEACVFPIFSHAFFQSLCTHAISFHLH